MVQIYPESLGIRVAFAKQHKNNRVRKNIFLFIQTVEIAASLGYEKVCFANPFLHRVGTSLEDRAR